MMMFTEMNPEQEQRDNIERLLKENNEILRKIFPKEKTAEEKAIAFEQKVKEEFYKELFGINKARAEQEENAFKTQMMTQIEVCRQEMNKNTISINDMVCQISKPVKRYL